MDKKIAHVTQNVAKFDTVIPPLQMGIPPKKKKKLNEPFHYEIKQQSSTSTEFGILSEWISRLKFFPIGYDNEMNDMQLDASLGHLNS